MNTTTAITGITAGPTAANDIVGTKDFAFVCLQVYICVYCIRGVILGGREGARYGRFWGRIWFGSSVFKSRRTFNIREALDTRYRHDRRVVVTLIICREIFSFEW